ncbi:hypothetical protein C6A85_25300, partial [Mycobacterium sp. ITM-2017-0098]
TLWTTDRYVDRNPFPAFKQGVGVVLQLPQPTKIGTVTVDVASSGTAVQIRSAPGDNPKTLADTGELSAPTPLQPGPNRVALSSA